jgi:two-component system sensor histidine kinase BaeS
LATRLVAALVLVVLTGVLTAWLVVSTVAPALFSVHMRQAGMPGHSEATMHAEEAFRSANVISLSLALLTAMAVSVAVSVVLARRVARTLRPVADAAADVARGHYGVQVPPPGLGAEFEELVTAFNDMARRLEGVEETRRRLLADLAHELRTPVTTLAAYLEAVEDGVTVLDADALAVMQAQTGRLTRLAQDVSAVSRAEEGHRTLERRPTPAATLVTAACAAARYAAQGVVLEHTIAQDLPMVEVDVERMAQVLGNLLDNALRHTPRGGRVTVTADTQDGLLRLRVTDTGSGITAEHLPHIFERFYRADAARDRGHGGSGIGLAIVKAYVQAHDGRVTAASNGPGQGTTVTITLPVTALTRR